MRKTTSQTPAPKTSPSHVIGQHSETNPSLKQSQEKEAIGLGQSWLTTSAPEALFLLSIKRKGEKFQSTASTTVPGLSLFAIWGGAEGQKKKKKISSELYEYCKNLKPSYCKLFLILKKWASRRTILEKKISIYSEHQDKLQMDLR